MLLYMRSTDWLRVPVVYQGDALAYLNQIDNMLPSGWYWSSREMAFPQGQDTSPLLQADTWTYFLLWLLSRIAHGVAIVFNLFVILSYGLNAAAGYVAARWLHCDRTPSVLVGIVFAFSYYQWFHLGTHLALGLSCFVPVWIALGVRWALEQLESAGGAPTGGDRHWLAALAGIAVIQSLGGVYYSVFMCLVIGVIGFGVAVVGRSCATLRVPLAVVAGAAIGLLGQLVVQLLVAGRATRPTGILPRSLGDIEYYSLQPVHLLLPADGYPIARVAAASARRIPISLPGEGGKYLGVLALAGLFALVARGLAGTTNERSHRDRASASMLVGVIVMLLLAAVPGGGGYVLGVLGLTEIRVWSRVVLPISFIGLIGLGRLLDEPKFRRSRSLSHAAAAVLLGLGVWEVSTLPSSAREAGSRWRDDQSVIVSLRAEVSGGSAFLQLPDVPYPEMEPINDLVDYEHFRPAILSDDFCWSYGRLRGVPGAGFDIERLLAETSTFLRAAGDAGYSHIWIDRRGLGTNERNRLDDLLVNRAGTTIQLRGDEIVIVETSSESAPTEATDCRGGD
jgi:hypothetical protein